MEDVDKEISFLEEKIAEMRERSDILKTSTPSRDSGVDTMRRASDTSQKKGELSYETGAFSGLRSNKRTEAHPRSNDQFSDSYELYEESERKVESSIGHRPFASGSGATHQPDLNWQADSLLPGVTRRRSRVRFESPARGNETDNAIAKQSIKPATYDGSGPWLDYHAHFEACADINGWSYATKGLYLAVSLRGNAQGVLGNMPRGTKPDFDSLVQALEDRFAPPSQTELYRVQMRERRQRAGETLPELGQAIQRLAYLAYPTASAEIRETLAKDQFVDALVDSEMRIRIKQSRPRHLNDAIQLAVELEAYNRAERKGYARPTAPDPENDTLAKTIDALNAKIDSLQLEVKSLKRQGGGDAQLRPRAQEQQKLCYYCRKPGHIRKDCKGYRDNRLRENSTISSESGNRRYGRRAEANSNQMQNKTNGTASIGANTVGSDAGLFLKMEICGVVAKLLVDTGATLTLISTDLLSKVSDNDKPVLKDMKRQILDAGGNCLRIRGRGNFPAKCSTLNTRIEAVVADLGLDGILGLDFFERHSCCIDIQRSILTIDGFPHTLLKEGIYGCYHVVAVNTVTIPANQEVLIGGKVCIEEGQNIGSQDYLVEPNEKFVASGTLVGRTLVKGNSIVPIRVLNIGPEQRTIYSGTHVAELSFCRPVQSVREQAHNTKLDEKLEELLRRCSADLTDDQRLLVRKFLCQYTHAFALTDSDLGTTSIVEHEIDVGGAHPIKEPLRRVPFHAAEEMNKHVEGMLQDGVIEPSSSPWAAGVGS
ncbi:uncharacterized protein [Magallana gigas]|uniref:uncharacterized protein n=1 Tax=Magallana gigas TaxID=29159 RepID=UPI0033412AAD